MLPLFTCSNYPGLEVAWSFSSCLNRANGESTFVLAELVGLLGDVGDEGLEDRPGRTKGLIGGDWQLSGGGQRGPGFPEKCSFKKKHLKMV